MSECRSECKETIPVWLDCDPGHDDAFTIILGCYSPSINLLGISIVHGNDSVDHCALNALRMLWACGVDNVPVYKGIHRPITREPKYCPEIHGIPGEEGVAGMCGYHFPDEQIFQNPKYRVQETHGVIAMSTAILNHPRKVTVVLTGAHTNFAFALRMYPAIKENIDKVVFMGGAIGLGNTGIAAEFNIQIDPEAVSIVLHSGIPLVMMPLEVTHQVLVTPEILAKLANIDQETITPPQHQQKFNPPQLPHRHLEYPETFKVVERVKKMTMTCSNDSSSTTTNTKTHPNFTSKFAECCVQLLTFFQDTYSKVFGFTSPPLHDPLTIFYLTHPHSFHGLDLYVDVETMSEKCAGRTLCDMHNLEKKPSNVFVCTGIDVDQFWNDFLSKVQLASRKSPMNFAI